MNNHQSRAHVWPQRWSPATSHVHTIRGSRPRQGLGVDALRTPAPGPAGCAHVESPARQETKRKRRGGRARTHGATRSQHRTAASGLSPRPCRGDPRCAPLTRGPRVNPLAWGQRPACPLGYSQHRRGGWGGRQNPRLRRSHCRLCGTQGQHRSALASAAAVVPVPADRRGTTGPPLRAGRRRPPWG